MIDDTVNRSRDSEGGGPPKPVDLATPAERPESVANQPQGIFNNVSDDYHDANVDLRHATLISVRAPKKGRYTITTKDGSSPITAISHADAFATPRVTPVAQEGQEADAVAPVEAAIGASMTIAEEGRT